MIKIKVLFTVKGIFGSLKEIIEVENLDNKTIKQTVNQRLKDHSIEGTVREVLFVQQL